MKRFGLNFLLVILIFIIITPCIGLDVPGLRIGTYNLQGYRLSPTANRPAISAERQRAVHQVIHEINADIMALQEVGPENDLLSLIRDLESMGLSYPYHSHLKGDDPEIHLAVLSKHRIIQQIHHRNSGFMHFGQWHRVRRGFLETTIVTDSGVPITLITAHLKSQLRVPWADADVFRMEEARLLRQRVDRILQSEHPPHLVVLGDLNDHRHSRTLKVLVSRGKRGLIDTCPKERWPRPRRESSTSNQSVPGAWTYYYAREDTWHRYDYILLSPSLAPLYLPEESWVHHPDTNPAASDHRPVMVALTLRKD